MDQREAAVPESEMPRSGLPLPAAVRRPLFGFLELSIASLIVVCDQATKALVRAHVSEYQDLEVIPGFLNFTHVRNSGAAFGMFNAIEFPYKSAVIAVAAAAALVAIAAYAARLAPAQ